MKFGSTETCSAISDWVALLPRRLTGRWFPPYNDHEDKVTAEKTFRNNKRKCTMPD
jgi:hypothetical protein